MKFNDLLFPATVTVAFILLSVLTSKPAPKDEVKPAGEKTPAADVR